jgi:hypothetical protein
MYDVETVRAWDDYRARVLEALAAENWRVAYQWTKGWVSSGWGAHLLDPWLLYAAGSLGERKPRAAVHGLDLGLGQWIDEDEERAVLRWVRGRIVHLHLRDPKTALADLRAARSGVQAWLVPYADAALSDAEQAAPRSRKRVPSVSAAPECRPPFVPVRRAPAATDPPILPRPSSDGQHVITTVPMLAALLPAVGS